MLLSCPVCRNEFEYSVSTRMDKTSCPLCGAELAIRVSASEINRDSSTPQESSFGPEPDDMYLDIETTGRSADADITVIVWLQSGIFRYWFKGNCPEEFLRCFRSAPRVVTFNGKAFDLPRICSTFSIDPPARHLDVFLMARDCGLAGGLKEITENLGIMRPESLAQATGAAAVESWYAYLSTQDPSILAALIYYCAWDVYLTYRVHLLLADQKHDDAIEAGLELFSSVDFLLQIPSDFQVPEGWQPELPEPPPSSKAQDIWQHRKHNPLISVAGATVCITGVLQLPRPIVEKVVCQHGGIVKRSVTKPLDFLVAGLDSGRTKTETALRYIEQGAHTRIITEEELLALIRAARTFEEQPISGSTAETS